MTPRGGTLVVLVFAMVWLWVGSQALPTPFNMLVAVGGAISLIAVLIHVLRRPPSVGRPRQFIWRRFWAAVAFEVVAANIAAYWLGKHHLLGAIWPVLGIIVGLHFIGLWWASLDQRYLTLTVVMTAINIVALFFPVGGAAMLAISGLGSSASLATATWRR